MAYGGAAVGRDPETGMAVFGWPAIKGEEAVVSITDERKNLLRGIISEVRVASPLRVTAPCPYFGSCGGCQWQHIGYAGQLSFKHEILRSLLQRIGGLADPGSVLMPPVGSPLDFGYRNTSHFAIEPTGKTLGYFKRESHEVIAVSHCPISGAGINHTIPLVNDLILRSVYAPVEPEGGAAISSALAPPIAETKGLMQVWKVAIRASERTGHIAVVFHSRAAGKSVPRPGRGPRLRRPLRHHDRPDSGPAEDEPAANPVITLRRRDVRKAVQALASRYRYEADQHEPPLIVVEVMDDGTVNVLAETRSASVLTSEVLADLLAGASLRSARGRGGSGEHGAPEYSPPQGAWVEKLAGHTYWVAPDAFFQVNTEAAELLVAHVADYVPADMSLLVDAHAGVGTFAIALAGRAGKVIGFELDNPAVQAGRWNALANNAHNVEFRHGRAEDLLARLPANARPDLVILDPPRSGCHPALLAELVRRRVPRIIYVSCDPSTLARDIKTLSQSYSLTCARVIDLFPQTYHLETVAVLDHRPVM